MKNNQFAKSVFLFLIVFSTIGCASSERVVINVTDYIQSRTSDNFLEPRIESPSPEKTLSIIDHQYYKNYNEAFIQAIGYGNYFLNTWYDSDYASQVANRMAWISLFLVDKNYSTLNEFDENLYHFCRAIFYTNKSIDYDKKSYWTTAGSDLKEIIVFGYKNPIVFSNYLELKKLIFIDIPNKRDINLVKKTIEGLQAITERYPDWIPMIVKKDLDAQIDFYKEKTT